jgi:hypothetical protein
MQLSYKISANIVEESNFVTIFQASQGTCLVYFTDLLAHHVHQGQCFFFLAIFAIFVLQPKWL